MVTTQHGGARLALRRVAEEVGFGATVLGDCATELVRGVQGRGALRLRAVVADVIDTGIRPLGTISFLAFAVGLILAASTSWVPEWLAVPFHVDTLSMRFIGVVLVREFTPLLLGLFVASRFGVALTARLGTMTLTQAIDALVVMGISPIGFVVLPALLAMLSTVLMLTVWCNVLSFAGIAAWFY
ncbi:MAG: ABC transporter permease, partial [Deltaproteobacteria bacterium]